MEAHRLSHRQLLENCLAGDSTGITPIALWRHFPVNDQSPGDLASAIVDFQHLYDFDLVKVTPASSFCIKDWGAVDEWRGNSEGTREYNKRVINSPEDWLKLKVLDPRKGALAEQLRCLKMVCDELGPYVPVLQTVFNPLSQAKNLVGGQKLLVHLRKYPEEVRTGLHTICETTHRFIQAACEIGIAGIFFAIQHASYQLLTRDEYLQFSREDDLKLLDHVSTNWLNMLHIHGDDIMFDLLSGYPAQVINWHDRETFPSLGGGKKLFPGAVCGGLQRIRTMELGTPDQVYAEAKDAIKETGNERFILGTGCVLPITTPSANINAAIKACRG